MRLPPKTLGLLSGAAALAGLLVLAPPASADIDLWPTLKKLVRDKAVDLTFVEKVIQEPPPPPPAPAPIPVVPAAAAPVVRPDQKIRKLDKPP